MSGTPQPLFASSSDASHSKGRDVDTYYFDSYSGHGIHEEMLKDEIRTTAYKNAIVFNPELLKGKIVLDVGCGTGILCMFAAQAGARHVFGVDCSAMAETATKIVAANGFSDRITIVRGKVEEIELPGLAALSPDMKVDVIVSEWMGYGLLYEAMLDSVLVARDRFLRAGGVMLPDKSALYVCGLEDAEFRASKLDFWYDVYGFDMSPVRELSIREAVVDAVSADNVLTTQAPIFWCDTHDVTLPDLQVFKHEIELRATRSETMHALLLYFDVDFSRGSVPVFFTTGPHAKTTHWKQVVLYLAEPIALEVGEVVTGTIRISQNPDNKRELVIDAMLESPHMTRQSWFLR
jgi:protein arginine N-methyltransferase 1